eukprot:3689388-Rhodomonas_salina.1
MLRQSSCGIIGLCRAGRVPLGMIAASIAASLGGACAAPEANKASSSKVGCDYYLHSPPGLIMLGAPSSACARSQ